MEEEFKLKLQNYDLIFGIKFGPLNFSLECYKWNK